MQQHGVDVIRLQSLKLVIECVNQMLGAEVISVGAAIVFAETVVDAELGLDEDGAAVESCVLPRLAETLRTGVRGMIMESIDVRRVEIVDARIMGHGHGTRRIGGIQRVHAHHTQRHS